MKRPLFIALIAAGSLTGCAVNMTGVREFADQTKRISAAFDPFLAGAVAACQQQVIERAVYGSERPLAQFDADALVQKAAADCKPIADRNAAFREVGSALSAYADQLLAIAGDGVGTSLDAGFDGLAGQLSMLGELPAGQVGAIDKFVKFLARTVIGRQQKQAIEEALGHEAAVGALGDALVTYSERVYKAYTDQRATDTAAFADAVRQSAGSPVLARLQLMALRQQQLDLQAQSQAVAALRQSVDQMKATMADLRTHLDALGADMRRQELQKLAKQVKSLYQQLHSAFKG